MQQDKDTRRDYTQAGFDSFLMKSLDTTTQPSLSSSVGAPSTRQMAYDRATQSGPVGDIMKVGNVQINGKGYIDIYDEDGNVAVRIGDLEA